MRSEKISMRPDGVFSGCFAGSSRNFASITGRSSASATVASPACQKSSNDGSSMPILAERSRLSP
jgi:hypothetical protein